jgi:hypothetical protein
MKSFTQILQDAERLCGDGADGRLVAQDLLMSAGMPHKKAVQMITESPIKQFDTYNWACAFQCAGETTDESYDQHNDASVNPIPGDSVSDTPFSRADVAHVYAAEEGENDGDQWIALMRLKDGRYAFLEAGCDYTGWD